jgi:hypothetical protein
MIGQIQSAASSFRNVALIAGALRLCAGGFWAAGAGCSNGDLYSKRDKNRQAVRAGF